MNTGKTDTLTMTIKLGFRSYAFFLCDSRGFRWFIHLSLGRRDWCDLHWHGWQNLSSRGWRATRPCRSHRECEAADGAWVIWQDWRLCGLTLILCRHIPPRSQRRHSRPAWNVS